MESKELKNQAYKGGRKKNPTCRPLKQMAREIYLIL